MPPGQGQSLCGQAGPVGLSLGPANTSGHGACRRRIRPPRPSFLPGQALQHRLHLGLLIDQQVRAGQAPERIGVLIHRGVGARVHPARLFQPDHIARIGLDHQHLLRRRLHLAQANVFHIRLAVARQLQRLGGVGLVHQGACEAGVHKLLYCVSDWNQASTISCCTPSAVV